MKTHGYFKLLICVCCVLLAAVLFVMPGARDGAQTVDVCSTAVSDPYVTGQTQTQPVFSAAEPSAVPEAPAFLQESSAAAEEPADETSVPSVPQTESPASDVPASEAPVSEVPASEPSVPEETENETAVFSLRRESAPANAAGKTFVIDLGKDYLNTLFSASDSIDYEFLLTERGVLRYTLSTEAGSGADFKVSLYQQYLVNGSGTETALRLLNVLNVAAEDGAGSSPGIGLMSGKYVLRVESGSKYANAVFRLHPDYTPGTEYEIEYNDSITRYTEIYPGITMKGSASYYGTGRDTDWYLLRLYTPGSVNLVFTHGTSDLLTVAFKVCLFTADGTELYGGSAVLNTPELVSGRIGLPAGVYYISVQSRVYSADDYSLTVQRGSAPSEIELNDSMALATPITQAQPLCGALVSRSANADKDYYVFTLEAPGYVNVWLKNDESAAGSSSYVRRLMLLDAAGHVLFSDMQSDGGAEVRSPGVGLSAGTYYLCVNNDNLYLNSETYQVGYDFTPSGSWEREYNGETAFATPITENVPVSGTLADAESDFDTDWFTFTVEDACTAVVRLRHEVLGGSNDIFNLALFDAAGNQLGETVVSTESTETVSGSFTLTPGTYYVKVTAGKYQSSIRYNLTYSIEK